MSNYRRIRTRHFYSLNIPTLERKTSARKFMLSVPVVGIRWWLSTSWLRVPDIQFPSNFTTNTQLNLRALSCGKLPSSVPLLASWLRALGFERPLGLCSEFRLEDPTYFVHICFCFCFIFFFYLFIYLFIYLGLEGNPLFLWCLITLVFRSPHGLLDLSKPGLEPKHTLEIICVWVR